MHGDNEYGYPYQVKNCYEIYKQTIKNYSLHKSN